MPTRAAIVLTAVVTATLALSVITIDPPRATAQAEAALAPPVKTTLRVPAGVYTGVVFSAIGDPEFQQSPIFTMKRPGEKYELSCPPGQTIVLEFKEGWKVENRMVTIEFSSGGGGNGVKPWGRGTAWGLTSTGPVQFSQ